MKILKNKPEIFVIAAFLILATFASTWIISSSRQQGFISKPIYLNGENIDGLAYSQVEEKIRSYKSDLEKNGLIISHAGKKLSIMPEEGNPESGMVRDNFSVSVESTMAAIKEKNESKKISLRKRDNDLEFSYTINEANIQSSLAEKFPSLEIEPHDASFYIQNGKIKVSQEKIGQQINYAKAVEDIKDRLASGKKTEIEISTITSYPMINAASLTPFSSQASSFATRSISVSYQEKMWQISGKTIVSWLYVENSPQEMLLTTKMEKIKEYISEQISPEIDSSPQMPKFEINGNKVTNWKSGSEGVKVNVEKTAENIKNSINNSYASAEIVSETVPPEEMGELGISIKEIIGTGHSNFSGSSSNRRHNIETGAKALQGLLIKPDEEFSLIKSLGNIDAENGYLPELVIKNNKTTPEYGGGLCQIGTTVFRTALASGLPIIERRNHSYRVSYYEPAGTDATIYDPAPDFKFKNDTGNYILIQYRIEGNDIYFDFWGSSDGRTATTTYPVIYNIVKPAATKIIETTDLAPGEKKCTESSHNGADAYFDYIVTYPATSTESQPEIKERRFSSHYVPWQAVCLVGTSTPETIATSTEMTTGGTESE